jgi:hypothetical protein
MARRKKTDQGERQTAKVLVWLTPTERAKLDKRIAAAGVPAPDFIRSALRDFRVTLKNPISGTALSELSVVGHRLNQLAKRANATGEIDPQELRDTLGTLREVLGEITSSAPATQAEQKTEQEMAEEERKWADIIEAAEDEVTRQLQIS